MVFGVPDGTGNFTVPGIKDGVSPFLQRRAYAQCTACSGRDGGKCCKADTYAEWHAHSAETRHAALKSIYSRTTAGLTPAKTTRQYPFVWGGTGPKVETGYPYHPPIFPDNSIENPAVVCNTTDVAAPVGCAANVTNIALRKDSTVARRTIISPAVAASWAAVTDKSLANNTYGCPAASIMDIGACMADNPMLQVPFTMNAPYGCYSIPISPELIPQGRAFGSPIYGANPVVLDRTNIFNIGTASVLKITPDFIPVCYTRNSPIEVRRGFMSCPPTFDVLEGRCKASAAGNWSTPMGCYEDLTSGTRYYSIGAGQSPIPAVVSAVCYTPSVSMEKVVQCQGPGSETLHFDMSFAGVDFMPQCDDPTDWRCRFQCG